MVLSIIRIVNTQVTSSTGISVTFNYELTSNLVPNNVAILAQTPNVPNSAAVQVSVSGSTLNIICQPLTEFAAYSLQFLNTPLNPFVSLHGEAQISQDGVSNVTLITGPIDPANPVYNYLGAFYNGNIYNINDTTRVGQYLNGLSSNLARAIYDIRQAGNENYLSFEVIDEVQIRGAGPFDRLNEEAAYEILRVGNGPTGATTSTTTPFVNFPDYPITLLSQAETDILVPNSIDETDTFNINTLTLNLSSNPVTRVNSITFLLATANPYYTYDISTLGYQIQNSEYDQDYASSYAQLTTSQIRLNANLLSDPLFSLDAIVNVTVQYEIKNLGRIVDPATITVFTNLQSSREVIPPIVNIFTLQHAPITDANNNVPTSNGVIFTDPNNNTPGALHPAFIYEIPYSLTALPFIPGQYAIDYPNATVYVYGQDLTNSGTGPFPPLATYYYRLTYVSEVDYVYDSDSSDLVAISNGSLVGYAGSVSYSYEQVFIPGVDYVAELHNETLAEYVNNNVTALNALTTQNGPITNVFQILNETSGEIYTLDRWYNNTIYFLYNNPPRILTETAERATFSNIVNELLFVNTTLTNYHSGRVFKIELNNNTIIGATEDGIATSFNTSMSFTDGNVFVLERWFSSEESELVNIDRLQNIGDYMVDYVNGIVYCLVSNTQGGSIGSINYKQDSIVPDFPHVISVEDIYYRISPLAPKNKQFSYVSFADGSIVPNGLATLDELYLNNTTTAPYQLYNGAIGVFVGNGFVPGVTNQVKYVRSVFEYTDLLNSSAPLNFANVSTSSGFNINVGSITGQTFESVQHSIDGYYTIINIDLPYLSPDITYDFNIVRVSDSQVLWNSSGIVVPGSFVTLILPGIGNPHVGDLVSITYTFTINQVSRVVIDYNKGDYFIDYTYVADEIVVSYEWGDNALDFRSSQSIATNAQYYVSYRVGALRDALLKNFGTLLNIPDLATFEVTYVRERYREALQAALSSFIQGPTVAAIKNIGQIISHVEPQVNESFLQGWALGTSLLNPEPIQTTGTFQLLPVKFGNGALVNSHDQTIKFRVNSNIRFEEGTFETWISPQWNGLDNDAELTFSMMRNGSPIEPFRVFVGAAELHPTLSGGVFSINKNDLFPGTPNTNKDGVFIYYDFDSTNTYYRWYVNVIDGYDFGSSQPAASYQFKIQSSGRFYDVKSITFPQPSNMSTFSGLNNVNMNITGGGHFNLGLTFISDVEHYILDFGLEHNRSRLSIYKDVSGYMNFRVFGQDTTSYAISADVSSWKAGVPHQVAASWKLNTRNNRDELHLFIDGLEVPNISKYGQKLKPYIHENMRTVDPEEVIGLLNRDIVGSVDLVTTAGSPVVSSSLNFSSFHIDIGDTIIISETGFSPTGYTIIGISGQTLTLNTPMPASITGGIYSVNQTSYTITSDINIAPNTTVSTIHALTSGSDLHSVGSNIVVSPSSNFTLLGVQPGYLIAIDDPLLDGYVDGYQNNTIYPICQVSGDTLTIIGTLPLSFTNVKFQVYSNQENELPGVRALRPDYSISLDSNFNNVLTITNGVFAGDLILVRTLGLNHRNVKSRYYVWSNLVENVLMTQLPPPINLEEADIYKVILPAVLIGPSTSIVEDGYFYYANDGYFAQPITAQTGRSLNAILNGTNIDFSTPSVVVITGIGFAGPIVGLGPTMPAGPVSDTLYFTDYGIQTTVNQYISVSSIDGYVVPLNYNKNAGTLEVKETYSMTYPQDNCLAAVVQYSYPIATGFTLYSDGYVDGYQVVTDDNNLFSGLSVGNYLILSSPPSVAGYYNIIGISADRHSLSITPARAAFLIPLTTFTNGVYQILNTSNYRSGFQNGFFTFEENYLQGQPYYLKQGFYDLDYSTYISVKMDPINSYAFVGSDMNGNNQANSIINEMKIYSIMLTDTRIGETALPSQRTITKDFNSLKPLQVDANTLMLITFNNFPFTNEADWYVNTNSDGQHFQTNVAVNDNFQQSVAILDKPIVVSNAGILNTVNQGTIEFWVNPLYDTANDPQTRFYFDAFGATIVEAVSVDATSVKISAPASQILSVTLKAGDPRIDYFAGGTLDIDTQRAVQEESMSIGNSSVTVMYPILQVISVKIVGDLTGTDYFAGGSIGTDQETIYLGRLLPANGLPLIVTYQSTNNNNRTLNTQVIRLNKKLPYQNSAVIVRYIPSGSQGDRLSIYKDKVGYLNFGITASGSDFVVSAPIVWAQNTWHRVKASYKINSGNGTDEMRLFIDGYEFTDVTFGSNIIFGQFPMVFGTVSVGDGYTTLGNIIFKDPINDLFIGNSYDRTSPLFSLIDNFRISNISRPIYAPYGEPIDVNYSSNQSIVFPVTSDLYTTYLMDFNVTSAINTSFTTIVNRNTGGFDFSVNILDSFGIVSSNPIIQQVLEQLINTLKPANSLAVISYTE